MPRSLFEVDLAGFKRQMGIAETAIERGTRRGLTEVAFGAMRFTKKQMPIRLDRPTPFSIKGIQVDKPDYERGVLTARVKISDFRDRYLHWQEFGGTETPQNAGASRKSGSRALVIPTDTRMVNKFGGAGTRAVKRAMKIRGPKNEKPFEMESSTGWAGVWLRTGVGQEIRPLLLYAKKLDYEPKLHFRDDAADFAGPRIGPAIKKRIAYAVRTGK